MANTKKPKFTKQMQVVFGHSQLVLRQYNYKTCSVKLSGS